MGVGISNRPLIRYIYALGAQITAFDMLEETDPVLQKSRSELERDGIHIQWSTGRQYLSALSNFDLIFRTPKMRHDLPELIAERKRGAVITSEMEVFMELCPARIWAVTGSDGKTTTTTLIARMLEQSGWTVHLGGNIGTPLLDRIESINSGDAVVLELSSFQLISMRKSPDIAVITNITPNHLDVHRDYPEYIDAKKNIFLYQSFNNRLVLNADNFETAGMTGEARDFVYSFSRLNAQIEPAAVLTDDGWLCWKANQSITRIVPADHILLPGSHNIENYLAAIAAVHDFAEPAAMRQVAESFKGVEHRLELVRELDGVRYFNSSIDTSPNRSIAALKALAARQEKAVLIMGGQDKKCEYDGLGLAILAISDRILLCGENADQIDRIIRTEANERDLDLSHIRLIRCRDYDDAVKQARQLARPGEVVVLTPAGTSFDRFRHFEERGNLFKRLVADLPEADD